MLEIYINTDSLTPAADIYADADKSTSLGRRVPFVRGERGKLRVGFLGGNAPSKGATVVLAVRAMDADKTELLRTEGAKRETVGGVPVYELDFVVDTVELSAALEKAESLTLLAGVVVKEGADADDAQNEWQFSMVISDTALRGNAPSPSPDPEPEHPSATLDGDNVFTGNNVFTKTVDVENELKMAGALRWLDGEGNTAVSLRFTDSPTGGVLNQGSALTTTAMTWMSGNYMSWFSSEFLRLYSGESVVSPTAKIEANPSGVILAAGAGDAAKIVVDAGKIQAVIGGSNFEMKLGRGDASFGHPSAQVYVDKSKYGDSYHVDIVVGDGVNSPTTHSFHKSGLLLDRRDYQLTSRDVITKGEMDVAIAALEARIAALEGGASA